MLRPDVILLHAPSVYDFRKHRAMYGPVADVIPSSNVFDMYPVGLTSIAHYLEERGYRTQIVNLAYRMLSDPNYDVERAISRMRAAAFGIDLHWLPHAHGSIEIARIIKKHHPGKPVIMGGLSASYFHRELMEYDCVDYVLRGDSTEEPFYLLLKALLGKGRLGDVPNLTRRAKDGEVKVSGFTHVPGDLDSVNVPNYRYAMTSLLRYGSFRNQMPFWGWLKYPMTMLLTSRGCNYNCVICGGSRDAYKTVCNRTSPAFRSPQTLIEDVRTIGSFSKAPVFVVHDLRQGGKGYAREFLERLSRERVDNEFIFELFGPADEAFLKSIDRAASRYSLQVSIESHIERIRKAGGGKFQNCSNMDIADTFRAALRNGCRKIDLFFIVGLPGQTYEDAVGCGDYCREIVGQLASEFGSPSPVVPYVAPYAPFLDPGCALHERPQDFGYKRLWGRLEDYRTALLAPSWKYVLNYETKWMDRHDIARATYDAAESLAGVKHEFGLMDKGAYLSTKSNLAKSRHIIARIDELVLEELGEMPSTPIPAAKARMILERLHRETDVSGTESVLCGESEMRWPVNGHFRGLLSLARLAPGVIREAFGSRKEAREAR